jgi:hypothetical protein
MKMINHFVLSKIKQFHATATSVLLQGEAEKIWSEQLWKFALTSKEVLAILDGWSEFVVTGNTLKLDNACNQCIMRFSDSKSLSLKK